MPVSSPGVDRPISQRLPDGRKGSDPAGKGQDRDWKRCENAWLYPAKMNTIFKESPGEREDGFEIPGERMAVSAAARFRRSVSDGERRPRRPGLGKTRGHLLRVRLPPSLFTPHCWQKLLPRREITETLFFHLISSSSWIFTAVIWAN